MRTVMCEAMKIPDGWSRVVTPQSHDGAWDAMAAAHEAYRHRNNVWLALFSQYNTDETEMIEGWYWTLRVDQDTVSTKKRLTSHAPPWGWVEAQMRGLLHGD